MSYLHVCVALHLVLSVCGGPIVTLKHGGQLEGKTVMFNDTNVNVFLGMFVLWFAYDLYGSKLLNMPIRQFQINSSDFITMSMYLKMYPLTIKYQCHTFYNPPYIMFITIFLFSGTFMISSGIQFAVFTCFHAIFQRCPLCWTTCWVSQI